jgi:hypothetical protein
LTPQAFTGEATLQEDDEDPEPAASDEKGVVVTTLEDEDDEDPEPAASDEEGVAMTGGSVNLYIYAVNFP